MGTNTDIHAQKLAEEALQDANRRKDEFLAMLAHELRNPLAPISAAADLLAMAKMDAARVQELSKIIARQIGHVTGLVDDLLDVSRVTRSLVPTDIVAVDLRQIMADAVEQPRPLIEQRRHRLSMRLPPDGVFVAGDRKHLVQVLANLLNKATKYTPDGGQIGLAVEANDHHVMRSVADSGIGMTPALATQAFDLFSQGERTADRSQGGLGLVLALVKSLVE